MKPKQNNIPAAGIIVSGNTFTNNVDARSIEFALALARAAEENAKAIQCAAQAFTPKEVFRFQPWAPLAPAYRRSSAVIRLMLQHSFVPPTP